MKDDGQDEGSGLVDSTTGFWKNGQDELKIMCGSNYLKLKIDNILKLKVS